MTGHRWWVPKNPKKNTVLGVLHAVKNIPVEALRMLLNRLGLNRDLGGKDLARRIVDVAVILLGIAALIWLIGVISGDPVGGPLRRWWE